MGLCMMFPSAALQRRGIARAITCGLLLVISGCIPNLQPAEPGPPIPEDFNGRSSPESSAQLGVDEFYQDPVLTSLVAEAMVGNQELKIIEQEIQIASTQVLRRRGAYLPLIGLRGEAGIDKHSLYTPLGAAEEQLTYPGDHHFPDPLPNFLVAADLFWQIDIWRELRNLRDAAYQRYIAAIERRNAFVTRLVAEVANNYFELMALDQRLLILDQIITLQQKNLDTAQKNFAAGRATDLPVQRFQAEVQKNQSEILIVRQEIIQAENRINFLLGRFPQPVERSSANFLDRNINALSVGLPAQLLLYRPDIRQAERELAAAGLEVLAARARFLPRMDISGRVGYEAFNPRFLFNPDALVGNVMGGLVVPVINRQAIQAEYLGANAEQLQAVYNYQRVILNAFTEVVNNLNRAENFARSVEVKRQQLTSLETAVDVANKLFLSARAEYIEVLLAQRDLLEVRTVLVQTKLQQLSAIVNAYQALGGGVWLSTTPVDPNGLDCPPLDLQPGDASAAPVPPAPDMNPDQEKSKAPGDMPADKKPAEAEPSPTPKAPEDKKANYEEPTTAPEAPQEKKPDPEKKPDGQESSALNTTDGHATVINEKTGRAVVPLRDGDAAADKVVAAPVLKAPPTLLPREGDLFEFDTVPPSQWEQLVPSEAQSYEKASTN